VSSARINQDFIASGYSRGWGGGVRFSVLVR
jgi:hypothetical protein